MTRVKKVMAVERLQKLLDQSSELGWEDRRSRKFQKWILDVDTAFLHIFGEDSHQYSRLQRGYTITPDGIREYLDTMASAIASCLDEIKIFWEDDETSPRHPADQSSTSEPDAERIDKEIESKSVFVIHGRNNEPKQTVARFLERIGLNPIILHEQPDRGRTIIEKFEDHADVRFSVVLLTPDDVGSLQEEQGDLKPRARQNVIFELGYFIGRLGRQRVCTLIEGDVEIPTDYVGILYNRLDSAGGWKMKLITELKNVGFNVDANDAL